MSEPVRFGIVGAGAIAAAYAEAIAGSAGAELIAVADLDRSSADAVAERWHCTAYASHGALLADGACEAIVVCTPPSSHEAVTVDGLKAGLAVLCEKPLALDQAAALRMVEAANRAGRPFTMGSKFRFVADVEEARRRVQAGEIGEVVLVHVTFAAPVDMSRRWNADAPISGGGVLIDNGTHAVDLARAMVGPISEVQAWEGTRLQGLAVEDTAKLVLRAQSGPLVEVDLSWSLHTDRDHFLELIGSEGVLRVGWQGSSLHRRGAPPERFGSGYAKIEALARQIEDFVSSVREGTPPRVSTADALMSVRLLEAAYRSMEERSWQTVDVGAP